MTKKPKTTHFPQLEPKVADPPSATSSDKANFATHRMMEHVAVLVKRRRQDLKMSQTTLGALAGISRFSVDGIEHNRLANVSLVMLQKVAASLELTLFEMLAPPASEEEIQLIDNATVVRIGQTWYVDQKLHALIKELLERRAQDALAIKIMLDAKASHAKENHEHQS